jgi:hypothetical protein
LQKNAYFAFGHVGYSSGNFKSLEADSFIGGARSNTPLIAVRHSDSIENLQQGFYTDTEKGMNFSSCKELEKDLVSKLVYYPDIKKYYYEKQSPLVRFSSRLMLLKITITMT